MTHGYIRLNQKNRKVHLKSKIAAIGKGDKMEKKTKRTWNKKGILLGLVALLLIGGMTWMGIRLKKMEDKLNLQSKVISDMSGQGDADFTVSWSGKTWCSYGDSITGYNVWQSYVTEYFGFSKHYLRGVGSATYVKSDLIWYANEDGSYNCQPGIAGVTDAPAGTHAVEGYLCSDDRIQTVPSDVDLVVIMAGTNDAGPSVSAPLGDLSYPFDETTFMGAVASTVIKMQEHCPNAVIVLASPFSGRGYEEEGQSKEEMRANQTEPVYNDLGLTTYDYAKAVKEVAEYLSIPYVDVFESCGVNRFNRYEYLEDLVHPTQEGGKAIAEVMIGRLKEIAPITR
jgi:lysophospholipase L1-like esterase